MEKIRLKRKIKSSTIKIKELLKFKDLEVEISITPIESKNNFKQKTADLLSVSVWDISEDVSIKSWQLPKF